MVDDLGRIPEAVRLSRATRSTINQNILVGAGISIVLLSAASYGVISPLAGALLHNVGEIYVIFNSARLLKISPPVQGVAATA